MIPIQEQSELSSQFKRKQIVIWGFLFLFILTTVGFIFYLAYRMMSEEGPGQAIGTNQSAIKIPVSSRSAAAKEAEYSGNYFLYGEFFPQDRKYKIFKVYYKESIREEIYSFLWSNPDKIPGLAVHEENIAIFQSADSALFINHNGKLAATNDFTPPSEHFSVSPDGKKMFYFKFMSSLGNPMLILRDLEKDKDIYTWPLNSQASEVCDFSGWSADGEKTYCLGKKGNTTNLKIFNAQNPSYSIVKTIRDANDAKYYAERSILLFAIKNKISIYNQNTKEEKLVFSAPDGSSVKNIFLTPDGLRVFYTFNNRIYSVNIDGSDNKNLLGERDAELVSLSTNSRDILFKMPGGDDNRLERYLAGDIEGKNILDLFAAGKQASGIQLIGWYLGENNTH